MIEEEIYLEHYGKKGMRWGNRKSSDRITLTDRFRANMGAQRILAEQNKKEIVKARVALASGKSQAAVDKAKSDYKAALKAKDQKGAAMAKKILIEKKAVHYNNVEVAGRAKDGKELAGQILKELAAGSAQGYAKASFTKKPAPKA